MINQEASLEGIGVSELKVPNPIHSIVAAPAVIFSFKKDAILKAQQHILDGNLEGITNQRQRDVFYYSDESLVSFVHQQNFKQGGGGGQQWEVDFSLADPSYEFELKLSVFSDKDAHLRKNIQSKISFAGMDLDSLKAELEEELIERRHGVGHPEWVSEGEVSYQGFPNQGGEGDEWMNTVLQGIINTFSTDPTNNYDQGDRPSLNTVKKYNSFVNQVIQEKPNLWDVDSLQKLFPSRHGGYQDPVFQLINGWFFDDMKEILWELGSFIGQEETQRQKTGDNYGTAAAAQSSPAAGKEMVSSEWIAMGKRGYKVDPEKVISETITRLMKRLAELQAHLRADATPRMMMYFMYGSSQDPQSWSSAHGCVIRRVDFQQTGSGPRVVKVNAVPAFTKLGIWASKDAFEYGAAVVSKGFSEVSLTQILALGGQRKVEVIDLEGAHQVHSTMVAESSFDWTRVISNITTTLIGGPAAAIGVSDTAILTGFFGQNKRINNQRKRILDYYPAKYKVRPPPEGTTLEVEEDPVSLAKQRMRSQKMAELLLRTIPPEELERQGLTTATAIPNLEQKLSQGIFVLIEIANFLGMTIRWPMAEEVPGYMFTNSPTDFSMNFAEKSGKMDWFTGVQLQYVTEPIHTLEEGVMKFFEYLGRAINFTQPIWFVESDPEIIQIWHDAGIFGSRITPPQEVIMMGQENILRRLYYGDMYAEELLAGQSSAELNLWSDVSWFDKHYFMSRKDYMKKMFRLTRRSVLKGLATDYKNLFIPAKFQGKTAEELSDLDLVYLGIPYFASNVPKANILSLHFKTLPQFIHAIMNNYEIDNSNLTMFSFLNQDKDTGAFLKTFLQEDPELTSSFLQFYLREGNLYDNIIKGATTEKHLYAGWKEVLEDRFTTVDERKAYLATIYEEVMVAMTSSKMDATIIKQSGLENKNVLDVIMNILDKVNTYSLEGSVRTLPHFSLSNNRNILGGQPAILNIAEPVINSTGTSPVQRPLAQGLNKHLSGIWRIFGYKHTIKPSQCYSEFSLIRNTSTAIMNRTIES